MPSVAGEIGLVGIVDQADGFATMTLSCTHSAVPGVKVDVGSLTPQSAAFPTGSDTLTFTFDISQDEKVKALLPGQSVTLPITAVVDPALLADACGCIANTLTTEVTYGLPAPTPVPTVGEFALGALALLVAAAAWRSGVGRQGLKALAVIGLGVGLMYPAHDLRAAGGNALDTITASLSGTTVTVTVKRNPNCVVNQPPALPSPIEFSFTLADVGFDPIGVVLPAASDVESEPLTYGLSPLPPGWSFDAQTRTLSGLRDPANPYVYGYICTSQPPPDNLAGFPLQLDYSVTDSCSRPVTVKLWCGAADGIPVGG